MRGCTGVDDCLVHFLCFYCASHQELRESIMRGMDGPGAFLFIQERMLLYAVESRTLCEEKQKNSSTCLIVLEVYEI